MDVLITAWLLDVPGTDLHSRDRLAVAIHGLNLQGSRSIEGQPKLVRWRVRFVVSRLLPFGNRVVEADLALERDDRPIASVHRHARSPSPCAIRLPLSDPGIGSRDVDIGASDRLSSGVRHCHCDLLGGFYHDLNGFWLLLGN